MIFRQDEFSYFTINSLSSFVSDFPLAGFAAQSPPLPTIGSSLFPFPSPQPSSVLLVLQKPPDHPRGPFLEVQPGVFWIAYLEIRCFKKTLVPPLSPSPCHNLASILLKARRTSIGPHVK